jgi:hypothetical protein
MQHVLCVFPSSAYTCENGNKRWCYKLGSNGETKQNRNMVSSSEEGFQVIKAKV